MARYNVHHLPVLDGERVAGLISSTDLLQYESNSAVYLTADVQRCESVERLVALSGQLPELQVQLVASGATGYQVGQAISSVTDAITRRLLELAEEELGPPPVPYAWMAVGSQARHEQTSHSDQDNALLLDDAFADDHAAYFETLAARVTDGLNACGFYYCPGDVMARNPQWRQPAQVWRRYFRRWIENPEPKSLMLCSNFFDMRPVHGEAGLWSGVQSQMLEQVGANRIFLAYMAANALHHRPPLGFFRGFVLIGGGDHAKTFDIKRRGVLPVVDMVRVYALAAGVTEANTVERLRAAAGTAALSTEGAADLEDALELISTVRARHQAEQIKRGEAPDNYLKPEELPALERSHLKDAFAVVSTMQSALEQRYQTSRLF
jgi:CBS domain-containing protein